MADWSSLLALGLSVAVAMAAASTGAIFKPGTWYERLAKPAWTPPNWAFPVVWSTLYLAMAISAWLVWKAGGRTALPVLAVYGLHLLLNAGWSWIFFGLRRLDLAMAELTFFWLSILAVIVLFAGFSTIAAWLLVPYLAWVSIAGFLNWRLLVLNGPRGVTPSPMAATDSRRTTLHGASPPAN
jgi:tryptophan-rich sensory protein